MVGRAAMGWMGGDGVWAARGDDGGWGATLSRVLNIRLTRVGVARVARAAVSGDGEGG